MSLSLPSIPEDCWNPYPSLQTKLSLQGHITLMPPYPWSPCHQQWHYQLPRGSWRPFTKYGVILEQHERDQVQGWGGWARGWGYQTYNRRGNHGKRKGWHQWRGREDLRFCRCQGCRETPPGTGGKISRLVIYHLRIWHNIIGISNQYFTNIP